MIHTSKEKIKALRKMINGLKKEAKIYSSDSWQYYHILLDEKENNKTL